MPGLGDDVQAIKAGILEIADVLCVNKADREGADRTVHELTSMLELRAHEVPAVEIVRTVATSGQGIEELAKAVDRHREQDRADPHARRRRRARATVREIALDRLRGHVDAAVDGDLARVDAVAQRTLDPYTAAAGVIEEVAAALVSG